MSSTAYALFPTAVGRCAIAWTEHGVRGVQLPEADDADTGRRLARRCKAVEAVPPAAMQDAIERIAGLLAGACDDLTDIPLDWSGVPDFERRVYEQARRIPPGRTATYGEVAAAIGEPGAARDVGGALGRNPYTLIVPCHRVIAAGGGYGGFSAPGGVATKLRLLSIERARPHGEPDLFD
jgi:methylated-DNA-[protein]-cysteine S-methyltransferase